jgi:hypothetical protein
MQISQRRLTVVLTSLLVVISTQKTEILKLFTKFIHCIDFSDVLRLSAHIQPKKSENNKLSENFPSQDKIEYLRKICNLRYFFKINSLLVYVRESTGETFKSVQKLSQTVVNTVKTSTTLRELIDTK